MSWFLLAYTWAGIVVMAIVHRADVSPKHVIMQIALWPVAAIVNTVGK